MTHFTPFFEFALLSVIPGNRRAWPWFVVEGTSFADLDLQHLGQLHEAEEI